MSGGPTSLWPFAVIATALATIAIARRARDPWPRIALPLATAAIFVAAWHWSCELTTYAVKQPDGSVRWIETFPKPWRTLVGTAPMITDGTLFRFAVASVYRVAVGFCIAAAVGIPVGLWAGWYLRAGQAIDPLIQALRPISPIAWIPLAVLWFGVRDASAIFLIALASFFPIVTGAMTAVRAIPAVYVRSAQNFGLEGAELFRRVVFPACLPQIVTSLRIALGIAWMVIVAAEMIAVDAGLGYLIQDARNANNYERVVGSMITIGAIGVGLDVLVRRLERLDEVRWGFPKRDEHAVVEAAREMRRAREARIRARKGPGVEAATGIGSSAGGRRDPIVSPGRGAASGPAPSRSGAASESGETATSTDENVVAAADSRRGSPAPPGDPRQGSENPATAGGPASGLASGPAEDGSPARGKGGRP